MSDYVVFVLSPDVEVDSWGDTLLRTLQAQGLPHVISAIPTRPHVASKDRSQILKSLLSFMQYFVPNQTRVFDLHSSSDSLNMLRSLSEGKPSDVRWREGRSWIVGERSEWREGNLSVTGFVRGSGLCPNRLVHIPGHGDFQIDKVRLSFKETRHFFDMSSDTFSPCPKKPW